MAKLSAEAAAPAWLRGRFQSVSRTPRELTVIGEEGCFPPGSTVQRQLRCIEVDGEFTLDAVGVVAAVSAPVAAAGISLFLLSVWSTDFVLVAQPDLARALAAWRAAGHAVREPAP